MVDLPLRLKIRGGFKFNVTMAVVQEYFEKPEGPMGNLEQPPPSSSGNSAEGNDYPLLALIPIARRTKSNTEMRVSC
ncbi:hypothetical protein KM043_016101 [Ampulex compressa]|nr:hypothetical protein KM043_016101 [Ampulex compressa]